MCSIIHSSIDEGAIIGTFELQRFCILNSLQVVQLVNENDCEGKVTYFSFICWIGVGEGDKVRKTFSTTFVFGTEEWKNVRGDFLFPRSMFYILTYTRTL